MSELQGPLAAQREEAMRLLNDIATTLDEIGTDAAEDRRRLLDIVQDLRTMFFMVAVIGEFNAGKSTFVNALLEDQLLPTGITPTTETIELIRYAEQPIRKPTVREDGIREWGHPNTGAVGVAIVDTPGTGSVFQQHEERAKTFLHRSDLVLFVLSAKRAFGETERLYLDLAKQYGKKVVLILNQIDLLAPDEQAQVRQFVEKQARDLLGIEPLIFTVSAKLALDESTREQGGIDAVRAHLRGVYAQAPPARQKLLAQLDTATRILQKQLDAVKERAKLVTLDTTKVRDVETELEQQALGLESQLVATRAEIDTILENLRQRGIAFIDSNLSVKLIGRAPSRDKLQAEFQDVVIGRSLRDLTEISNSYINAVVDRSRQYWRDIVDRLNRLRDLLDSELSGLDTDAYTAQRESLEQAIRLAEAEMKSYSTGKVIAELQTHFQENLSRFQTSTVATVAGFIVTILALAAPGPVLGAGALATASLAFVIGAPLAALGGISALRYFRRVTAQTRQEFNEQVDRLQRTYHDALEDLTRKERNRLTQYGKQILSPVYSRLESLAQRYAEQQKTLQNYADELQALRERIEKVG